MSAPVTSATAEVLAPPQIVSVEAGQSGAPRGRERESAAMLTVLTTVLVGIVVLTGGLGLSSLFVLAR
jgi:hypothetical protein